MLSLLRRHLRSDADRISPGGSDSNNEPAVTAGRARHLRQRAREAFEAAEAAILPYQRARKRSLAEQYLKIADRLDSEPPAIG
jgi:hypothetical protein